MLATLSDSTVGPAGVGAMETTIRLEVVPDFLARPGAVEGLWLADRATGRTLTVTIWGDRRFLEAGPGDQVLTVVGRHRTGADGTWARVTWLAGAAAASADLEALHLEVSADQARSEGFCGSCWLLDEDTGQGVALSLWDGPHALIRGEHDSKRRRRELERRLGASVTNVSELECLAVAAQTSVDYRRPGT